MAYEAFILLPSDTEVSIEKARQALQNYFADSGRKIGLTTEGDELTVTIDGWNCYVDFNSEPYVAEESKELAESYAADRSDKDEIAAAGARLEISSDDDEDMEYFNDYLEIAQTLGEFPGAKVWEGAQEEFIDIAGE